MTGPLVSMGIVATLGVPEGRGALQPGSDRLLASHPPPDVMFVQPSESSDGLSGTPHRSSADEDGSSMWDTGQPDCGAL